MAGGRDNPTILNISVSRDTISKAAVKSIHYTVRWFPLVEACLYVCCELEGVDVVGCLDLKPC